MSAPAAIRWPAAAALLARDRIEAKAARHGLVYPWWIAVVSAAGLLGAALIAAVQRDGFRSEPLVLGAVALVVLSCLLDLAVPVLVPWFLKTVLTCAAVAWFLQVPVTVGGVADFAPAIFAIMAGEVTATDGGRRGVAATAVMTATLMVAGSIPTEILPLYLGEVLFGLVIGYMLRWQMRALAAEHLARQEERVRATLAERQRVAREIHDLVAHSLSVTMLHVTGARRVLADSPDADDVAEAVEALTDAERVGREAMADIRRTVSVLHEDAADLRALPTADDLDELVAGFRAAGLEVTWTREGDLSRLAAAAGLGLYRVVQESLTNVVKHAPGAAASVRLVVDRRAARLSVTNPVLQPLPAGAGGSGVLGMTSRIDQLGGQVQVGPDGDRWRVDLAVPLDARDGHRCPVSRMLP